MNWLSPHALQVLASPGYGLLFWTPLAAPALAGLVLLSLGLVRRDSTVAGDPPRAEPRLGLMCLLMVAGQIYVSGSLATWQGGAFGQRRLVGLTIFLVIGLAALFRAVRASWPRRGLVALVIVCTWWNLGLIAQFGASLMSRDRLQLSRNAYHNFVTIPRALPDLVYRYAFNRESFYHAREAP
jgi:hypothetical protein